MTLAEIHTYARMAARKSSRWVYRRTYVGGAITIACREPGHHETSLMTIASGSYADIAEVSVATARAHLRKLAAAGRITEQRRGRRGAVVSFALPHAELDAIGREIIAELVAEGIAFEDDWRAAREGSA